MYCMKCGNKVEDNAEFCNVCGKRIPLMQAPSSPEMRTADERIYVQQRTQPDVKKQKKAGGNSKAKGTVDIDILAAFLVVMIIAAVLFLPKIVGKMRLKDAETKRSETAADDHRETAPLSTENRETTADNTQESTAAATEKKTETEEEPPEESETVSEKTEHFQNICDMINSL